MPSQVSNSTLVGDVVEAIRRIILARQMQPGEFLPTGRRLARRYRVGLSTVYEAIQELAAVAMLQPRPAEGPRVR